MKSRLARWFLAGFTAAIALGAIGSLIALRRGVMLADEEARLTLPIEETADAQ
jgi:ABC-type Mn2+/Zn2+ transport system permease subunit